MRSFLLQLLCPITCISGELKSTLWYFKTASFRGERVSNGRRHEISVIQLPVAK